MDKTTDKLIEFQQKARARRLLSSIQFKSDLPDRESVVYTVCSGEQQGNPVLFIRSRSGNVYRCIPNLIQGQVKPVRLDIPAPAHEIKEIPLAWIPQGAYGFLYIPRERGRQKLRYYLWSPGSGNGENKDIPLTFSPRRLYLSQDTSGRQLWILGNHKKICRLSGLDSRPSFLQVPHFLENLRMAHPPEFYGWNRDQIFLFACVNGEARELNSLPCGEEIQDVALETDASGMVSTVAVATERGRIFLCSPDLLPLRTYDVQEPLYTMCFCPIEGSKSKSFLACGTRLGRYVSFLLGGRISNRLLLPSGPVTHLNLISLGGSNYLFMGFKNGVFRIHKLHPKSKLQIEVEKSYLNLVDSEKKQGENPLRAEAKVYYELFQHSPISLLHLLHRWSALVNAFILRGEEIPGEIAKFFKEAMQPHAFAENEQRGKLEERVNLREQLFEGLKELTPDALRELLSSFSILKGGYDPKTYDLIKRLKNRLNENSGSMGVGQLKALHKFHFLENLFYNQDVHDRQRLFTDFQGLDLLASLPAINQPQRLAFLPQGDLLAVYPSNIKVFLKDGCGFVKAKEDICFNEEIKDLCALVTGHPEGDFVCVGDHGTMRFFTRINRKYTLRETYQLDLKTSKHHSRISWAKICPWREDIHVLVHTNAQELWLYTLTGKGLNRWLYRIRKNLAGQHVGFLPRDPAFGFFLPGKDLFLVGTKSGDLWSFLTRGKTDLKRERLIPTEVFGATLYKKNGEYGVIFHDRHRLWRLRSEKGRYILEDINLPGLPGLLSMVARPDWEVLDEDHRILLAQGSELYALDLHTGEVKAHRTMPFTVQYAGVSYARPQCGEGKLLPFFERQLESDTGKIIVFKHYQPETADLFTQKRGDSPFPETDREWPFPREGETYQFESFFADSKSFFDYLKKWYQHKGCQLERLGTRIRRGSNRIHVIFGEEQITCSLGKKDRLLILGSRKDQRMLRRCRIRKVPIPFLKDKKAIEAYLKTFCRVAAVTPQSLDLLWEYTDGNWNYLQAIMQGLDRAKFVHEELIKLSLERMTRQECPLSRITEYLRQDNPAMEVFLYALSAYKERNTSIDTANEFSNLLRLSPQRALAFLENLDLVKSEGHGIKVASIWKKWIRSRPDPLKDLLDDTLNHVARTDGLPLTEIPRFEAFMSGLPLELRQLSTFYQGKWQDAVKVAEAWEILNDAPEPSVACQALKKLFEGLAGLAGLGNFDEEPEHISKWPGIRVDISPLRLPYPTKDPLAVYVPDVSSLEPFVSKARKESCPLWFITKDKAEVPGSDFLRLDEALLRKTLGARGHQELCDEILKTLSLVLRSGYHSLGSIRPGEGHFFGRERILEKMIGSEASFAIYGPRRMGKTSLLQFLGDRLRTKGQPVFYVDCSNIEDEHDFLNAISSSMERSLNGLRDLEPVLRNSNRPPVFLLDEFDKIIQSELFYMENAEFGPEQKISAILRALVQQGLLRLVVSGFWLVSRSLGTKEHPFYNLFPYRIFLGSLEDRALEDLLTIPMREIEVEYENRAFNLMKEATMGIPWLIQDFAVKVLERLDENREDLITREIVQAVLEGGVLKDLPGLVSEHIMRPGLKLFIWEQFEKDEMGFEAFKAWCRRKDSYIPGEKLWKFWQELLLSGLFRWPEGDVPLKAQFLTPVLKTHFRKMLDPVEERNRLEEITVDAELFVFKELKIGEKL